jgi:hypothetical protein
MNENDRTSRFQGIRDRDHPARFRARNDTVFFSQCQQLLGDPMQLVLYDRVEFSCFNSAYCNFIRTETRALLYVGQSSGTSYATPAKAVPAFWVRLHTLSEPTSKYHRGLSWISLHQL